MSDQTPLPLNTILVGNHDSYQIRSLIGRGGFGVTYQADIVDADGRSRQKVAIKEFFPKDMCERLPGQTDLVISDPSKIEMINRLRTRFLKESRNLSACHISSVVKVLDTFEANGTAYVVMELIEGMTLKEYMKSRGDRPMDIDQARRLILQAASALRYLHDKNINHLDIKPANMMVTNDLKRLVLIDFGLSRQYNPDGSTDSEIVAAVSKGYASPEQYAGVKRFSPESDIYSLGATFYNLITGKTPPEPFDLNDNQGLLEFPGNASAADIRTIRSSMRVERKKRLGSAAGFIESLTSSARDEVDETRLMENETVSYSSGSGFWHWIFNIFMAAVIGAGLFATYIVLIKRRGDVAYEFYFGSDVYEVSKSGFCYCLMTGVGLAVLSIKTHEKAWKFWTALIAVALVSTQIYYAI